MTPDQALARVRDRLDAGVAPAAVIEELLPQAHGEAVVWAGRLPAWDEHRDRYPGRVVALARLVSRRAMREHGLVLTADGRVADQPVPGRGRPTPRPARVFPLSGGAVRVEYTPAYLRDRDHFQFKSPHDPARPIPLSESGWWSHFADPDAVEALGGPEAYAALYAGARIEGREKEFEAGFDGRWPGVTRRPRKARPVVGEHTGGVVAGEPGGEEGHSEPPDAERPPAGRLF